MDPILNIAVISALNPMWVTGFTDAEGSFTVSINKRESNNNWQVRASFELGLHSKDKNILEDLRGFFKVGLINTRKSQNLTSFTINKNSDLINIVIPHFSKYPLQSQKRIDFELWAKIVNCMKEKEHLTPDGLFKILSLKSALNRGLPKNMRVAKELKSIKTLERSLHLVESGDFMNLDPHWISGFVAGDGTFDIKITKRKINYQVELRFRVTQHIRDAALLGLIAKYLECGKVYVRSTNLACDLVVTNFPDNFNKIIPFFKKFPILTNKEKDFKDFVLAAEIMNNKAHLTPEGLSTIKELKLNMNNNRSLE